MNSTPTHQQLVEIWLEKHFKDVPCVVFMEPLGNGDRISLFRDRLGITCGIQLGSLINSDIFILPTEYPEGVANKLPQEQWGFVMSWNGSEFTSHN